ncbi:unnamed protein product [Acanthoscelides obtectus]|uniref:Odorant receptor n=1 Tax=Acanthoscelides obtectus TaxID=200917 RepID=A0A9P0Q0H9_ACAOB|nr:unnamed protein product [Acanthoscelides obtectus]CAK1665377.1 Odorant receptor 22b [Acanthoscelides obtectus]
MGTFYLIALYIQRPKIAALMSDMRKRFWSIENYNCSSLRKEYLEESHSLRTKCISYVGIMLLCATVFCYGRIIQDGEKNIDNMLFKSYIPEFVDFWILFAWEHIPASGLVVLELSLDVIVLNMLTMTKLQFRLLRYEIENMFCDNRHNSDFDLRIKRCSDHHTFLLEFRAMLNDTFSYLMLIYMGVIILILCIEMYLIMSLDSLADVLGAAVYAAQMFFEFFICYCCPAQDLKDEAELLSQALYFNDWHLHPSRYKNFAILLGKSQIKVIYSAGGLMNLDLQTGMAAVKTMLSYSMFLQTMTQLEAN